MQKKILFNKDIPRRWYHNFLVLPILLFIILLVSQIVGEVFSMEWPIVEPYKTSIYTLGIGFGMMILLILALVKYGERRDPFSIGLLSKTFFGDYLIGFILGITLFSAIIAVAVLLGGIQLKLNTNFNLSTVVGITLMLAGFTIQGSGEEILTRGYMLQVLSNRYNIAWGIFFSSFYFGILHSFNPGITFLPKLNLVLFGFFAALIAIYKNQIITVCGLHVAWNWVQGNIYGVSVSGLDLSRNTVLKSVQVSGKELISGGNFGLEGSILCTIAFALGSIYYLYKIKSTIDNQLE